MSLRIRFLSALLSLMFSVGFARADYGYVFTNSSGSTVPLNAFTIAPGSTSISINVYLAQTGASTGLTTVGLESGGVQLNTSVPTVATVTAVAPNVVFDQNSSAIGASAFVIVNQVSSAPVVASGTPVTGSTGSILLGTFTFTALAPGSTLTVTAVPSTGTNVNVLGDGTVLDGMLNATPVSASITSIAIPEPGSMLLAGLAVSGFGAGVLRRRLLRKPEPTPAV